MTPSQNTVLFWYPRSVNDDWTSLLLAETWVLSLPPPLPYVPPTHIPSLSSILIDSAPDVRLKSVRSSPSLLPRPSHLSLTAVSPSQPPHDCRGDLSTTWIWSVTIPLPNPSVVSHLALDRTQTPYTHRILHGLLCLSSLISLTLPSIHQHMGQWPPQEPLGLCQGCLLRLQYHVRPPVPAFYSVADIFSIWMSFRWPNRSSLDT